MALEKDTTFVAACDFCTASEIDTEEEEFIAAVAVIRSNGWFVFREKNEWFHKCPGCQGASADDFEDVS